MDILVIGGGGREHAIVKKLKENPGVGTIYALPGNGGMTADAVCVPEIGAKDISAQVEFAKAHQIGFAVVAPDDPLVLGAVDALEDAGIPCFGPEAKAAVIEGSKVFSKNLMKKYGIPTEDIIGKRKTDAIATARQVAIYLLRELTEMSFANIGKVFNRDHSTVVASVNKVKDRMKDDSSFEAQIDEMIKDVRAAGY